jgi:putative ABC transport system ATP-binding protein
MPGLKGAMTTTSPVISVRNLSHGFGQGALRREVLHRVSADFYPGEIVIIMGPSGSGKTTFLTLVGGLRAIEEGSVIVDGDELVGTQERDRVATRRKVGFIFQSHNLIESLTVCENVQMPLISDPGETSLSSRAKALAVLANVGLAEHANKLPKQLSGGQKQRVAIARALVRKPSIIMADEPTASLDKKSGREVVDMLQHMARNMGCAVLLVTHDNRILDVADRLTKIEDGSLEDSYVGMERLIEQLAGLSDRLSAYTDTLIDLDKGTSGELGALRARFAEEADELNSRMLGVVQGHLNPAMHERARTVQDLLGHLIAIEASLAAFVGQFNEEEAREVPGLGDRLAQSLQFLLLTAADVFKNQGAEDAALLLALTGDRGEAMNALRTGYFKSQPNVSDEARVWLFGVTNAFARNVYLVNQLAILLQHWVSELPEGLSATP